LLNNFVFFTPFELVVVLWHVAQPSIAIRHNKIMNAAQTPPSTYKSHQFFIHNQCCEAKFSPYASTCLCPTKMKITTFFSHASTWNSHNIMSKNTSVIYQLALPTWLESLRLNLVQDGEVSWATLGKKQTKQTKLWFIIVNKVGV
jgi:hypothetical protein